MKKTICVQCREYVEYEIEEVEQRTLIKKEEIIYKEKIAYCKECKEEVCTLKSIGCSNVGDKHHNGHHNHHGKEVEHIKEGHFCCIFVFEVRQLVCKNRGNFTLGVVIYKIIVKNDLLHFTYTAAIRICLSCSLGRVHNVDVLELIACILKHF